MRLVPAVFLCVSTLMIVGCSATPRVWIPPVFNGKDADVADGTRPYYCTEDRLREIATYNTAILRHMANAPLGTLPSSLMGPQRKDTLIMRDKTQLEAWYFRSHVDSINTSYGYDVGLTPIVIDSSSNVLAVGAPATEVYRAKAATVRTVEYQQACQAEDSQATGNWTDKPVRRHWWVFW